MWFRDSEDHIERSHLWSVPCEIHAFVVIFRKECRTTVRQHGRRFLNCCIPSSDNSLCSWKTKTWKVELTICVKPLPGYFPPEEILAIVSPDDSRPHPVFTAVELGWIPKRNKSKKVLKEQDKNELIDLLTDYRRQGSCCAVLWRNTGLWVEASVLWLTLHSGDDRPSQEGWRKIGGQEIICRNDWHLQGDICVSLMWNSRSKEPNQNLMHHVEMISICMFGRPLVKRLCTTTEGRAVVVNSTWIWTPVEKLRRYRLESHWSKWHYYSPWRMCIGRWTGLPR